MFMRRENYGGDDDDATPFPKRGTGWSGVRPGITPLNGPIWFID
jgi:hypothetical protein